MIADLRPYPAMKDSGVEWLGNVPQHWKTRKIKNLARPGYKTFVDGDWIESPYITSDGIRLIQTGNIGAGEYKEKGFRYISEETFKNFGCTEIELGDVLICRLGEPVARACLAPQLDRRMITSVDVCILKPRGDAYAKFLVYSMSSYRYLDWVGSLVRGSTRDRVSRSMLGSFLVPVPPLSEQTAIVRFLDHADRRIRRYIRAKQKMIALLEEQKRAIIHQAVTGQFDVRTGRPYPAYRPSGVNWLEKVPEQWDLRPAKWYLREADDRSETGSEELLSVSHITGVTPRSEKNVTMFKADSNVGHKLCRPGDIVINTMWAWMAALGVAKQTGIVSPSYAVYRPHSSSRLLGKYADLLLRTTTYKSEYICRSTGIRSSRLRLYPEEFLRIKLLCPPPKEQRAIVEFVSEESTRVRRSIDLMKSQLSYLCEYHTRLIADVVTGRLDVREAAAALPEVDPLPAEDDLDDAGDPDRGPKFANGEQVAELGD